MKAGADFKQTPDSTAETHASRGWLSDTRDDFQQCGFARAIAADQSDNLALLDIEADALKGPNRSAVSFAVGPRVLERALQQTSERVAEVSGRLVRTDLVLLAQVFRSDDGGHSDLDNIRECLFAPLEDKARVHEERQGDDC